MILARDERADLTDFLAGLTPDQWRAPSLCAGWSVSDVVAHVFSYDELGPAALAWRFVRSGILLSRANETGIAAHAEDGPSELLALARKHQQPKGLTTFFNGKIALTDATIHHQDIRRPLGLRRTIPPERLAVVLDFAMFAPPIGASKRVRGLSLVASDLDWSSGRGPSVEGPAESLLMAIAGRPGVVGELAGPGQAILAERIGS